MVRLHIAILDDASADRETLLDYTVRWAEEAGVPLNPSPLLVDSGEGLLNAFVPGLFDVTFLDIYLNGFSGVETARRIRRLDDQCCLVFSSSSPDFATDSYEVNASWYLLKPYSYEKVKQALDRCSQALLEKAHFISVPGQNSQLRLPLHQIAWTEYENRKILVHFKDGSHTYVMLRQGEMAAALLCYPYFCDCMKGLIVNLEAVEQLLDNCFLLRDGHTLPISRLKYRAVREQFLNYSYTQVRDWGGDTRIAYS